jgi:hypothetical protein
MGSSQKASNVVGLGFLALIVIDILISTIAGAWLQWLFLPLVILVVLWSAKSLSK